MRRNNNNNNRRRNNQRRRNSRRGNNYRISRFNFGGNSYGFDRTYLTAVPDAQFVKLKYNEVLNRAPANIIDSYVYRFNSLYDPNLTGVGGQPAGFDQWATLYGNYEVSAASIRVRIFNNQATATSLLCVYPTRDSSALTYTDAVNQAYSVSTPVGPVSAVNTKTIRLKMSVAKLMGRNTSDLTYTGSVAGNPTVQTYFVISALSADASTNLDYSLDVEITFWARFFSRSPLIDV